MTPTRALIEAAERAKLLLRGLTVGEVMERGIESINSAGLNPYCINEGRATGNEWISTDWLEAAISSAKAAEEGVDRAALLLVFKTAWNSDRGRDNMALTLAYAEAVRVLGITQDELKEMAKEKPPEGG